MPLWGHKDLYLSSYEKDATLRGRDSFLQRFAVF